VSSVVVLPTGTANLASVLAAFARLGAPTLAGMLITTDACTSACPSMTRPASPL